MKLRDALDSIVPDRPPHRSAVDATRVALMVS